MPSPSAGHCACRSRACQAGPCNSALRARGTAATGGRPRSRVKRSIDRSPFQRIETQADAPYRLADQQSPPVQQHRQLHWLDFAPWLRVRLTGRAIRVPGRPAEANGSCCRAARQSSAAARCPFAPPMPGTGRRSPKRTAIAPHFAELSGVAPLRMVPTAMTAHPHSKAETASGALRRVGRLLGAQTPAPAAHGRRIAATARGRKAMAA